MTNDLLYLLLRASINASLSDRDAFIEKVSKIIEQQTHKDPEAARRLSDHIAGAMEAGWKTIWLDKNKTETQNEGKKADLYYCVSYSLPAGIKSLLKPSINSQQL